MADTPSLRLSLSVPNRLPARQPPGHLPERSTSTMQDAQTPIPSFLLWPRPGKRSICLRSRACLVTSLEGSSATSMPCSAGTSASVLLCLQFSRLLIRFLGFSASPQLLEDVAPELIRLCPSGIFLNPLLNRRQRLLIRCCRLGVSSQLQ